MSPPKDRPAFKRLDNPEVEVKDFFDEGIRNRSLPATKNNGHQVSVKIFDPFSKVSEKQTASTNSGSVNQDSPAAVADNKLRY